ncbi:MAG: hypothetical protein WC683_02850 [bacterium]
MDHRLRAVAALLLLTDCGTCEPPPPKPPGEPSVQAACDTLCRFKCPECTPKAMSCQDSLSRLLEVGTVTPERLSCISGADGVEQLATCKVKCAGQ